MEKMNQVSVSEFMNLTKTQMYDMAVEMVEKYNRLVDICNDSAERMAELATRHNTYTNALNKDIAAKAAKIDLLEKEIEGRKEGYVALKTQMDNLKKEYEEITKSRDTWFETAGAHGETIRRDSEEINKLKDEIVRLNKCIMNKNESINTGNEAIINLRKEIGAHEEENKKLENRIKELKNAFNDLREEMANRYIAIETHNDICKSYENKVEELEKQNEYLTKELEQTYKDKETDLKNHNKRDMALVEELADKNDKIKNLVQEVEYYKNQERIRTDQLRATESKVEELWKRIEGLRRANRIAVNNAYGLASASIREEDDHGRAGFKKYIEWLIEEEERAVPERFKARLNEEITEIFEKEEETEVKGVGRTSSGRYPWGAKVNDIPCGEDAIE